MLCQKEHYAARIIQKAFRNWRGVHGGDGGDIIKEPPPSDDLAIEIPPELNDNDKSEGNNEESIEMDHLDIEDNADLNEDRINALNAGNVSDQTVVEVDLKPDSDVVA